MDSNIDKPVSRGTDRRASDRRKAEAAFAGSDRREGQRRKGGDRRTAANG